MFRFLYLILLFSACSSSILSNSTSPPFSNSQCLHHSTFSTNQFTGSSLSPYQLSLTFDDGPGSRTLELSSYLRSQNIHATFFINGHCFNQNNPCGNYQSPDPVLPQLLADGHLAANHTQDHYNLTSTDLFPATTIGLQDIVSEVINTDNLISQYVDQNHFLFRPPYGAWDDRAYSVLNNSGMNKYYGPIKWDIGGTLTAEFGADWDCWQNAEDAGVKTTEECGQLYLNEIRSVKRGIVLMHDADYGTATGNTVDMVKWLVPILKSEGYSFVRADEVPEITAAMSFDPPPPPTPTEQEDADLRDQDAGDSNPDTTTKKKNNRSKDDSNSLITPMIPTNNSGCGN